MKKTTVIIPNYNGIKYLEDCVKSVLKSDSEIDIIIVDNGSSDGSREIIEDSYKDIKVISLGENTGFCHAMNVGIAEAKTDYVFALNDDTLICSDTIRKLEKVLDSDKKVFSVQAKMLKMSDHNIVDSAGDEYCVLGWAFSTGKDKKASYYENGCRNIFSACAGAALYRKSIIDSIGGFDENHFAYLEDVDLGYRALLNGYKNKIELSSVVYHAGSGSSGSRYNDFKTKYSSRNSIYLIYKNMPILQLIFNLPFIMIGYLIKIAFFMKKGMGKAYINGLLKGLDFCATKEAKANKVHFRVSRLATYLKIEVYLIINVFKRLG